MQLLLYYLEVIYGKDRHSTKYVVLDEEKHAVACVVLAIFPFPHFPIFPFSLFARPGVAVTNRSICWSTCQSSFSSKTWYIHQVRSKVCKAGKPYPRLRFRLTTSPLLSLSSNTAAWPTTILTESPKWNPSGMLLRSMGNTVTASLSHPSEMIFMLQGCEEVQ